MYLAEDIQLARQVAVKLVASRGNAEQGLQEARMLARLNHANIVQIHSVFELEQQLAIVMEYVPGQTLFEYQYSHMANMTQKLGLLCQIAEGLAAAHQQGIIHCDLKPANILLDHQQQVKITDFGIARLSHHTSAASFTYGSQAYMSPEQLMDKALDYRSDLFSFGILAFHLLSGWHPFGTGDNQQLAKRIVEGEAMCAHKNIPGVPEALAELLNQLLAALPAKRPSDTLELAQRLRAIHKTMVNDDIISQATLVHKPQRKPVLQRPWFKRAALSLAGLSLCSALGVAGYQIFKPEPKMLVVLEPELTTTDQAFLPQAQLVAATVDDALRQSVINSDNMRLIPRSEAKGIEGIKNIALATGATDIIQSSLHCNQVKCDISLSQISGKDYTVQKQKQWPVLNEEASVIFHSVNKQFNFMNGKEHLVSSSVKADYYSRYIKIYESFRFSGHVNRQMYYELRAMSKDKQRFRAVISLFRDVSVALYHRTNDKSFIYEAKDVITDNYIEEIPYLDVASLLSAVGEYQHALKQIDVAEREGVDSYYLSYKKALIFIEMQDYERAIDEFNLLAALKPSYGVKYNLALAYWWKGDVDFAAEVLEDITNLSDNPYPIAVELLSSIYLLQGKFDKAIEGYLYIINNTAFAIDYSNLSLAYLLNGDVDLSLKYAKLSFDEDSTSLVNILSYADVLELSGEVEKSALMYEKILKSGDKCNTNDQCLVYAQAMAHLGRGNEAIHALESVRFSGADNGEIYYIYSLVYSILSEKMSAYAFFEKAIENDVSVLWFNIEWFEKLCEYSQFRQALKEGLPNSMCD